MVSAVRFKPAKRVATGMSTLIASLGEDYFGPTLLDYLVSIFRLNHISVIRFDETSGTLLLNEGCHKVPVQATCNSYMTSHWTEDHLYGHIENIRRGAAPSLLIDKLSDLPDLEARGRISGVLNRGERVVICGNAGAMTLGISLFRSDTHQSISDRAIERIGDVAPTLLTLIDKHERLLGQSRESAKPLASLPEIERCIAWAEPRLPRREAQVCARILYGISSLGIALDIGVGEETVATYRKRVYRRLGIGSQHELLRWYFTQRAKHLIH